MLCYVYDRTTLLGGLAALALAGMVLAYTNSKNQRAKAMKTKRPLNAKYDYHALVMLGADSIVEALRDNVEYCGLDSRQTIGYAKTLEDIAKAGCHGYACHDTSHNLKLNDNLGILL